MVIHGKMRNLDEFSQSPLPPWKLLPALKKLAPNWNWVKIWDIIWVMELVDVPD